MQSTSSQIKIQENRNGFFLTETTFKQKIDPKTLMDPSFQIPMARVGLKNGLLQDVPAVIFDKPNNVDFVSIMRCPKDSVIMGGDAFLIEADRKNDPQLWQRNLFWERAQDMGRCQLLNQAFSDTLFLDQSADSGDFFYLLRPCVDAQKLDLSIPGPKDSCSRFLTVSTSIHFENFQKKELLKLFQKSQDLEDQIDTLSRSIFWKSQALYQNLFSCQNRHDQSVISKESSTALSQVIGLGIGGAIGTVALGKQIKNPNLIKGLGAGVGALGIGFLTKTIFLALQGPQSASFPQDDPSCYDLQTSLTSDTRCSCAGAFSLKGDISLLTQKLQFLIQEKESVNKSAVLSK